MDASKIPTVLSVPEYLFKKLNAVLPEVAQKPWLYDVSTGKHVLFGDVERLTRNVARALVKRGFKKGDSLFYACYDNIDLGILILAVWMLGGTTRGNYADAQPEDQAKQMKEIKCKFVAVEASTAGHIQQALQLCDLKCEMINLDDAAVEGAIKFSDLSVDDGLGVPEKIDADLRDAVLFVCNTSGSTGSLPKGVIHTHRSVGSFMASSLEHEVVNTSYSQLVVSSNFAISNMFSMSFHLATGRTKYCMSRYEKDEILGHILKHKPTHFYIFPFLLNWLARSPMWAEHDFSFIKRVLTGGSLLDATTFNLLKKNIPSAFISMSYASTECLRVTSIPPPTSCEADLLGTTPNGTVVVTSGLLYPKVEVKILKKDADEILGPNKLGRLFIRSPYMMKGYLIHINKEPDRSSFDAEGWFDTGDIAFVDEKNCLYVRGRVAHLFDYYTHSVNPADIEEVLQEHPSVRLACVIPVPKDGTNFAKALVVLNNGKAATSEELIQLVSTKLPDFMHLHGGLQFVESLPESKGRKLDTSAVIALYGKP